MIRHTGQKLSLLLLSMPRCGKIFPLLLQWCPLLLLAILHSADSSLSRLLSGFERLLSKLNCNEVIYYYSALSHWGWCPCRYGKDGRRCPDITGQSALTALFGTQLP
jgi:hypothetical protein